MFFLQTRRCAKCKKLTSNLQKVENTMHALAGKETAYYKCSNCGNTETIDGVVS